MTDMSVEEQLLASSVYTAMMDASRYSVRGNQAREYRVGLSDLGYCSERTRRMLNQEDPDDTDLLPAFIGTALGDWMERACKQQWPHAITQALVTCPLVGEQATYQITGHPDLILPTEGIVIDFKTSRGLAIPRRTGPSRQQQMQRHCYGKGAWLAGLFGDLPLEQVQVANIWLDRAGDERTLHCHLEPYDERIVEEAALWVDEVIYAYIHQQAASKEPAYEVCKATCGFFATCREGEVHTEGLLTDADVLAAVDIYREGVDLEREAKRLKDQGKAALVGVAGSTGEYALSWTWVNGTEVSFTRQGYNKMVLRKVGK